MQVGDLVQHRIDKELGLSTFGIIIADRGLSWQQANQMWLIEWTDGQIGVMMEHQLEVVCSSK